MDQIKTSIDSMFNAIIIGKPVTNTTYMKHYSDMYAFCTKNTANAADIYSEYIKYINMKTSEFNTSINSLEKYSYFWTGYTRCCKVMNSLMSYINRHYIMRKTDEGIKIFDIIQTMYHSWYINIIQPNIHKFIEVIMNNINKERDGDIINSKYIISFVQSILIIDSSCIYSIYKKIEQELFNYTMIYYKNEITNMLGTNSIPSIIHHIDKRLKEEDTRIENYFHTISKNMHIHNCEVAMIYGNINIIMNDFINMLEGDNIDDIKCLYNLVSRLKESILIMGNTIYNYIIKFANETIEKIEIDDYIKYIEIIGDICAKYNNMCTDILNNNSVIMDNINKALVYIINTNKFTKENQFKTAEFLSKAVDSYMKETDNIDFLFDRVMIIYRYLSDRDAFQKFNMKMYAKRLIGGNVSDDNETNMITRLKDVSDYDYITRLQKMMNDIKTSRDINSKFKAVSEKTKIDLNCLVLTSGPWPLQKGSDIILPTELAYCIDKFTAFYLHTSNGRKLNWLINLSKGEIKTLYSTKPKSTTKLAYTFSASTIQIAILLCFNGNDDLTIDMIATNTGIDMKLLEANMDLLVKMKILVVKDDLYNVNMKYNYKKLKVKIDMPIKMETKAEADDTKKMVDEDRGFMIDACIVRIMKSRNVLKHIELIDETIKQLSQRFKPDVKMIKKKIDSLIEREYMKRTEGKRDEYQYVA
jgi:cullin 1